MKCQEALKTEHVQTFPLEIKIIGFISEIVIKKIPSVLQRIVHAKCSQTFMLSCIYIIKRCVHMGEKCRIEP